ncbi:hypothetical protein BGZ76_002838 [Entomortierella beljakovae]|nr:hypothetical protein BGZ76_002838 [Entomortierella beljakovae]
MVALTKPFSFSATLLLSIVLLGTAMLFANAAKTAAPAHTPKEMSRVVDCQAQCIALPPPFRNKPTHHVKKFMRRSDHGRMSYLIKNIQPIVQPCLKNLRKLKGNANKVTEDNFQSYVLCNSKTLGKNEEPYFSKNFNYKKNGFSKKQWTEFRNHTLPAFRSALHRCRGGCRKVHFPPAK